MIWISIKTHWVVTRKDDGEGSVFDNEEIDLEINRKLLADWTAYGGDEEVFSEDLQRSFHVYTQGSFPSWQGGRFLYESGYAAHQNIPLRFNITSNPALKSIGSPTSARGSILIHE